MRNKLYDFDPEFIYSENIYAGWMEGMPLPEHNVMGVNSMLGVAKKLCEWIEPIVIKGESYDTEILPPRGNVAHVVDIVNEKQCLIVWFDTFDLDPRVSLNKILEAFDWSKAIEWGW